MRRFSSGDPFINELSLGKLPWPEDTVKEEGKICTRVMVFGDVSTLEVPALLRLRSGAVAAPSSPLTAVGPAEGPVTDSRGSSWHK